MADKIDSNVTGLRVAEEASLKVLPASPVWTDREPNSYDDLGGEYAMTARKPFNKSRQRKKGVITDLDADGGFNEDLTQSNMKGPLEGFFFAAIRKKAEQRTFQVAYAKAFTAAGFATDTLTTVAHGLNTGDGPFTVASATTLPAGLSAATNYWVVVITADTFKLATTRANAVATVPVVVDVTGAGTGVHTMTSVGFADTTADTFVVNNPAGYLAGNLLFVKNFANALNNGLKHVTNVTAAVLSLDSNLVTEAVPPATASVQVVGHQFDTGSVDITVAAGTATLARVSGAFDFTTLGLIPGEWVFLGGDATANKFVTNVPGYARVKSIAAAAIVFDKTTFTASAEAGTGKDIRIFFGSVLKNESDEDLIIRKTYTLERSLGRDSNGIQSELLPGSVSNEMTWTSPLPGADAKVTLDLSYVAMSHEQRDGTQGLLSAASGTIVAPESGADCFNTASNIYRLRLAIVDPTTLNPTPLFARVTEWSMSVNNNVTGAKAQGTLGSFDASVGGFDVDGEFTAYFSTVAAVQAVRNNSNVTFDAIYSKANAAIVMDVPLVALGGGRLEVEQDTPIMVPLETAAAESPFGHTILMNWLDYVPNAGVAS